MNQQNSGSDAIMGTSYTNPTPMGIPVKTRIERGEAYASPRIYKVEVTALETLRGTAAVEKIQSEGAVVGQPKPGNEFILVKLKIKYAIAARVVQYVADGEPFIFSENQFSTFTIDGNREETTPLFSHPHPFLNGSQVPPGGLQEGWLLLQVIKDDTQPLLVFKRQNVDGVHGIWGSIWFKLY